MSAGRLRPPLAFLAFGAALVGTASAHAEETTLAQASFERGRQAIATQDYQFARTQFEASYRADPALGALLNLAVCEQRLGLWNAALKHLDQALRQVGREDKRGPSIVARIDELSARIPHLTLRSKTPLAANVVVSLDATSIAPASLGAPLPIDPGPHTIRCEAEHDILCFHEFEAHDRELVSWWVELDEKPVATQAPPAPQPPATVRTTMTPVAPRSRSPLVFWTGGIGLASLALGLGAGAEVLHWKSTMSGHCDSHGCDSTGVAAAASGTTWSWVSTIATGIGVAGLGTSIYLSFTPRSSQGPGAEVAVRGNF
jgi:hypothetical protein